MPKRSNQNKNTQVASSSVTVARGIKSTTQMQLFARAAGRCEFDGCNKSVLEHGLTLTAANFGQMAHIVAFKEDGPRGLAGTRPVDINSIDNLMLLCPECHKLVDDHPMQFPRALLEGFKKQHEQRIARVTEIGPDRKTSILVLKAPIGGQAVAIADDHIFDAVLPRYPVSRSGTLVDLGQLTGSPEDTAFLEVARGQIDQAVQRLMAPGGEYEKTPHLSIFGLAPIPLLIHLGARLSNKVPADFYQRHRDTERWEWKTDGEAVKFAASLRRSGRPGGPIVLVLGLSGSIPTDSLPAEFDADAWIYEIALENRTPDPTFLRLRAELDGFRLVYQAALGLIAEQHGIVPAISVIPAVPAPIAVLLGRERLPKVHPALRVYDRDRVSGTYRFIFNVD